MARPIKETPILFGEDAKRFMKEMEETRNKRASKEERERIEKNYQEFKKACTFNW
ncbi:hypothetical protein [Parabacteroides sp. AF48-14]|jgi:hypothetical protein|uniref:hypothetical protein n=1 Tax=Parabacteroides sp. AF48-14 TaxID=2292052 RepID=UPI0018F4FEA9|nr:hypothetical protein [Parabacteroides sp. AF48-14]